MKKKVFKICSVCKGACCRPDGAFLTRNEAQRIERETGSCLVTEHGPLLKLKSVNGACQFLTEKGCILKEKPVSCLIYPLLPTRKGWVLRLTCPYWRKITDDDIQYAIQSFERLKADWRGETPE